MKPKIFLIIILSIALALPSIFALGFLFITEDLSYPHILWAILAGPIIFIIMVLLGILSEIKNIRQRIKQDHRGVVFRMGSFSKILEPGNHITVPILDKTFIVDLEESILDWQKLTQSDLENRMIDLLETNIGH